MATRTEPAVDLPETRPDHEYAFVAGLYVAALLAPAILMILGRWLQGPAALYVGFLLATTTITLVAGLFVSRIPGAAVRLGRHSTVWLLAVLPIGWYTGVLATLELTTTVVGGTGILAMFGGAAGILVGLLLARMSRNRYTAARLVDVVTLGEWEARWPRTWRRAAVGIAGVATALGLGAIILGYVYETDWVGRFYLLLYVWAPVAGVTAPRTYRVTDAGLVVERPMLWHLRPWSTIESYTLTETALVIHRTTWWRPALRSDRADIEDVDAVVGALEDVLAQRGHESTGE